ncbi:MAG: hydantoinase B/oxoprolinase family protein [Deltaproteobacteria bacterium]|nr:hydantoinase B/oxoprolinase family protein [Deltaproteobacteria bacterium]
MGSTGGAASADADSWMTICHAGNAGMCCIDSVEMDEMHFPILVKERRLLPDTEGSGSTLGAPSLRCEFGPVENSDFVAAWVADGTINVAKGACGGLDGSPIKNYIKTAEGKLNRLPACAVINVKSGETIVAYSAGGGGFGRPHKRPIAQVKEDVKEGYISVKKAYDVYGLVFNKAFEVDLDATNKRREALSLSLKKQEDDS